MQDRHLLGAVKVKLAPQPLRAPSMALSAFVGMRGIARQNSLRLPHVVRAAADTAGNPSACLVSASVCEVRCALGGSNAAVPECLGPLRHQLLNGRYTVI